MNTLTRALYFLGLIFWIGNFPGAGWSAESLQRIRIAYASRSNSATPQYVAQDRGFFKAEGLEVELIQMNPRLGATAVVNGDVSFATPFVSTFRGTVQGLPIKLVFVHLKKGPYFLMVRKEIKDVQQLKGKKLGVATIKGADQLVAEELLQTKGFNPSLLQAVGIGEAPLRMQALVTGAVDAVCVSPGPTISKRRFADRPSCRCRPTFGGRTGPMPTTRSATRPCTPTCPGRSPRPRPGCISRAS